MVGTTIRLPRAGRGNVGALRHSRLADCFAPSSPGSPKQSFQDGISSSEPDWNSANRDRQKGTQCGSSMAKSLTAETLPLECWPSDEGRDVYVSSCIGGSIMFGRNHLSILQVIGPWHQRFSLI